MQAVIIFLLLVVDDSVGSGVITRGKLLGDTENFTCELGHTSICFNGRRCVCGNRGCLEAYASIPNLLEGSQYSSWKDLIDHLGKESSAEQLLDREAEYLSTGITNVLNLIQLDTVYLAGDIRYGFEHIAWRIQNEINSRAFCRTISSVQILRADTCEEARLLAAGDVVVSRYLTV